MLTIKEAARIGIDACIDKIGREFVEKHRDNGTNAYGKNEEGDGVYCYVGIDDKPYVSPYPDHVIVLDSITHFPYFANCNVRLADGAIEFLECVVPA